MLTRYNSEQSDDLNTAHSVTLVPRLEYSVGLLSEIVMTLDEKLIELRASNEDLGTCFDGQDPAHLQSLELERTYLYCYEALSVVKKRTSGISRVASLPEILPSLIPMIRTISAQLHGILPNCSQKLSELSVHLGSIALDSATLTKARFDFGQSNEESAYILDKVKLMADSKLSKQYPNVDFV